MMRPTITLLLLVICFTQSRSQDFLSWKMNDRYYSGQLNFGFASYRGELKHNNSIQNEISNYAVGLEARLLSHWAARVEIGRYNIRGNDKHAPDSSFWQQRNLSFSSVNYEATIQAIYFIKKYKGDYYKRHKVDPYLQAGIGTTHFSPTAVLNGVSYKLYEYQTENKSYRQWTMIIPVGAGIKWRINPFLNFNTEFSYRFTFTDYLDDVSGSYPTTSFPDGITGQLSNRKDEVGVINQSAYDQLTAGNPRGNSSDNDRYLFINFKFEFFFPPGFLNGTAKKGKKPAGY